MRLSPPQALAIAVLGTGVASGMQPAIDCLDKRYIWTQYSQGNFELPPMSEYCAEPPLHAPPTRRPAKHESGADDTPLDEPSGRQIPLGHWRGKETSRHQEIQTLLEETHFLEAGGTADGGTTAAVVTELLGAVDVLQERFFETWQGTWPAGIDWTRAVLGTQVSGALRMVSQSHEFTECAAPPVQPPLFESNSSAHLTGNVATAAVAATENTLAAHFSQIAAFYFGENALDLRGQAFDDMLWVVLGWLEAVRLVDEHSARYFEEERRWFAAHFVPAFAHRARIFWGLARKGWDEDLCGGGMTWNPRLKPYKNAITNELFIAASASMYLWFPGDDNGFPFTQDNEDRKGLPEVDKHDEKYLNMAIKGYDWLYNSNMTNDQGLFVDGFHVTPKTTVCGERSENVFTYNQGVILTGQRDLWAATGNRTYLADGHRLIMNVIRATGYDEGGNHRPLWSGLGRYGIIEETCDAEGRCSQDGQTFKGIFFHHLAAFCQPLPVGGKKGVFHRADRTLAFLHRTSCEDYAGWVARNARAALGTKDEHGVMGTWWLIGGVNRTAFEPVESEDPENDYRNHGVPRNDLWMLPEQLEESDGTAREPPRGTPPVPMSNLRDPNDRGRGRTPETQSSGIAVVKALYLFADLIRTRAERVPYY